MNNWPSYLPTSLTYDDFLTDFQFEDSPEARQVFEGTFNLEQGADHVPLKNFGFSPGPVDRIGVHGRLGPEGDKRYYDHPALHDKFSGPAGDYRAEIGLDRGGEAYEREGRNFLTATDRFYNRDNWNEPKVYPGFVDPPSESYAVAPVPPAEYTPGLITPGPLDQTVLNAPEGYSNRNSLLAPAITTGPTGAAGPLDATAVSADSTMYGGDEALLAEAATDSAATDSATGLSGPQAFAANMALNMIPTRDRKKMKTALGDEGSFSGITKGGAKGALVGSTFGPQGALVGGLVGAGLATQGYFDSTTPPSVQIMRIKQRGGRMPQGLLGGIYA